MSGEEGASKAECYKCDKTAEANCAICGKNTCKIHGKYLAEDKFACWDCINAADNAADE